MALSTGSMNTITKYSKSHHNHLGGCPRQRGLALDFRWPRPRSGDLCWLDPASFQLAKQRRLDATVDWFDRRASHSSALHPSDRGEESRQLSARRHYSFTALSALTTRHRWRQRGRMMRVDAGWREAVTLGSDGDVWFTRRRRSLNNWNSAIQNDCQI